MAVERNYLVNAEDRPGRPLRLTVGEPMPAETLVPPHPDSLMSGEVCVSLSPAATP